MNDLPPHPSHGHPAPPAVADTPAVETLRPVANLELKAAALLLFTLALIVGSGLYLLYARGAFEPTQTLVLTAALFVAMRCTIPNGSQLAHLRLTGRFEALRRQGSDPVRIELLPRVIAGVFACITLAALSCVVALVLAYLGVYGFNTAGLSSYTRMFGQVFSPSVTMVFVLKTLFFSLTVALIPMAAGLYDSGERTQPDSELGGLARMFAVLLLIEVASLMGNYY